MGLLVSCVTPEKNLTAREILYAAGRLEKCACRPLRYLHYYFRGACAKVWPKTTCPSAFRRLLTFVRHSMARTQQRRLQKYFLASVKKDARNLYFCLRRQKLRGTKRMLHCAHHAFLRLLRQLHFPRPKSCARATAQQLIDAPALPLTNIQSAWQLAAW